MIYEYATKEYISAIYDLQHSIFKGNCAYSKKDISNFVNNNNVIIATQDSLLKGFVIFGKGRYELNSSLRVDTIICLAVSCEVRKQGVARQLMNIVHSFKKQWFLHVKVNNDAAIKLYKSLGYIVILVVKDYYTDEKPCMDAYYMRLDT